MSRLFRLSVLDQSIAVSTMVSIATGLTVARFGSEEQKREWLPKLIGGELIVAIALTEPRGGSDAANLGLRMERHVANAQKVAEWLEKDPRVEYVTYAGLKSSPYNKRAKKIVPKGAGALFTFALKGGYDACVKLIDNVKLFSHVANLGDTRSLIIHSASTTHRQLTEAQQIAAGAAPNVVRVSIGIEDAADLWHDLESAIAAATR